MNASPDRSVLIGALGLSTLDEAWLGEALRDESWVNEHKPTTLRNNKNLAFVGDAVMELVVRHELFQRDPGALRDKLSKEADNVVPDSALANPARKLFLGDYLDLGNARRDKDHPTVLARAFEALLGAVFVDQGFAIAAQTCRKILPMPV